ncbi:MAG TPA: N,N-dimethylformamidase beta subunit family domain-containing protein [Acidisoma sp.]|uniref:N,N-dimethylformamidase beta subunit family domain-containing protein n=1 Tax=Acidisoma sp. TaxID=1872115 RepID=UPI002CF1FD8B|nr:N,N-dimethylformamidase beta subunit family domain-containing protein [Acidisoma sp.]HTI01345.1 N,N-dimethylformamidase beta subunit family domain-containing protein [Acidisoma sp.]
MPEARLHAAQHLRFTFECLLTTNPTPRTLLRLGTIALQVLPEGVVLQEGPAEARAEHPLWADRWMRVTLSIDDHAIRLMIDQESKTTMLTLPVTRNWRATSINLGGDDDEITVNACWARPVLTLDNIDVAVWHFPPGPPVAKLSPVRGDWPPLAIHNLPTFAMASMRWDGTIHDPRLDPTQYDAIHCHDDDMAGLDWPVTHHIQSPEDAEAGIYAAEITTVQGIERIPFFLRAKARSAPLVFLVPTLTYLAYADENLPQALFPWLCHDRGNRFAQDNGLLSLYDRHSDGSGVSLTTTRRPKATLRDDHLYPLSGSPHLLPVDLQLLRFCRNEGIAFDLVTDHDLHQEGRTALVGYRGVFTGSHPEYWTTPMQDALRHFIDSGGSLAYLGGNGFMWVTAVRADLVEVRRGQGLGARTWDGHPGEINLSLTGEIGGLWRERGRSEFSVVGTGMTMMGFGPARPYRRRMASDAADYFWVFEGVTENRFGLAGTVLGGAAGYEVDRTDPALGTHPETVVLAAATGFDESYATDPNEFFATPQDRARARVAEMVIRRTPQGGLIFGAGSVAWCGALPSGGEVTSVGQITANVLRRMA